MSPNFSYPSSPQQDVTDVYHGVEIKDSYRWLENPDSEETKVWITAQNKLTFDYLSTISAREKIKQRLTKLWDYEKYGIPFKKQTDTSILKIMVYRIKVFYTLSKVLMVILKYY